jgi:hypothetical protein
MRTLALAGAGAAAALLAAPAFAATKTFSFEGFERVSASAGVDVEITAGAEYSVVAEGSERDLERLNLELDGAVLDIGRKPQRMFFGRTGPVTVRVSLPQLLELRVSSGAEAEAKKIDSGQFKVKASSGASARVEGVCIGVSVEASSGADIDASELKCEDAAAEASSGADAELFASKSLIADASSGGSIRVHGAPKEVNIDKSSGGSVRIVK